MFTPMADSLVVLALSQPCQEANVADDQNKIQFPDPNGKVIKLNDRPEHRNRTGPIVQQTTPGRGPSVDGLRAVLDTLLVAQFELCGVDPHPTRASLSEMRFRQALEALAAGIGLLKQMAADATPSPAIHPGLPEARGGVPEGRGDVQAAD